MLDGAGPMLDHVKFLELEVSIVRIYEDAPVFWEGINRVFERGFSLVALEQNGGDDETTGQMLMIDAIFRSSSSPSS